jgi:hypothetical protein
LRQRFAVVTAFFRRAGMTAKEKAMNANDTIDPLAIDGRSPIA